MRFKKLFIFLLLSSSILAQETGGILLDQIEATVNDSLITRQDVLRAVLFYPILQESGQSAAEFQRMVLDELIDYKVVSFEFQDELSIREEDYEAVQLAVIAKLGSLNALYPLLRKLGMSWIDFKAFIRERVIYEKVIAERLETRVVVSFREIEAFYRDHYMPLQQKLGLSPASLVEMTAQIERHLAKRKFADRLQGWLSDLRSSYRIEYLSEEELR